MLIISFQGFLGGRDLVILVLNSSRDPPEREMSIERGLSKRPEGTSLIVNFVAQMDLKNLHNCHHNDQQFKKLANHMSQI